MLWQTKLLLSNGLRLLRAGEYLTLTERLSVISRRKKLSDIYQAHVRDDHGEPYIELKNRRIFFRPSWATDARDSLLFYGTSQVITETLLLDELNGGGAVLKPGDIAMDWGANIGLMALVMAEGVGARGKVIAFEPVTPDLVRRNLQSNGATNVTVEPLGVAETSGSARIHVGANLLLSSLVDQHKQDGHALDVGLTSLDDYAQSHDLPRLDFIKIAIEGFEEPALRGGEQTIRRHKPAFSISSYHTDSAGEKQHPKLVKLLESWGYRTLSRRQSHIWAWCDQ